MYFDGETTLAYPLPPMLFERSLSVTILSFLTEGTMLPHYLNRMKIPFNIRTSKSALRVFQEQARELLSIEVWDTLSELSFSYTKQESYRDGSKEAKKIAIALKNLKQRSLAEVTDQSIMLTCRKDKWYQNRNSNKHAGAFAKGSRMFNGVNWLPNTTRGTNDYIHCSHLIYLYEQNANPAVLDWLGANNRKFKSAYAISEMIQWIWRSRARVNQTINVYMPSSRMRRLLNNWIFAS